MIAAALFFGTEKLVRTQTDGFRLEKTESDYDYRSEWEVENDIAADEFLDKPYYFLGSGVQCYAFISEDQNTVLKIFKHYHLWPTSTILKKLPLPHFLERWQQNILKRRENRIESIFSSAIIAKNNLSEQTGVFYLNLNKAKSKYPEVVIYDKIGIRHIIDLNKTPFLLQKKADMIFPYLQKHRGETRSIIDSLFSCISARSELGIANTDPLFYRNFGILQGKVLEIDIGSFVENTYIKNPLFSKRELFYQTLELKEWVTKNAPEHYDYFEQKLMQAIRT